MDIQGNYCVYDSEPQRHEKEVPGKWDNPQGFGFSCGVIWDKDGYKHYFENDVQTLVADLQKYDLVVGFNHLKFDYGVLSAYTDFNFSKLPSFDILKEIYAEKGHYIKLENLAMANFSKRRGGNLYKAVQWYKKGDVTKVKGYCEKDVEITRELFLLGLKQGYLDFHRFDNPKEPDTVDATYWPKKVNAIAAGENFILEANWRKKKLVKHLSIEIELEMECEEGDGSLSHSQTNAITAIVTSVKSMDKWLQNLRPPITMKDVQASIKTRLS